MGFRAEARKRLQRHKRLLRILAFTVGGLALTVGGALGVMSANAACGGSGGVGSGCGGGSAGGSAEITWTYHDNNDGGYGAPTNANVKNAMTSAEPGIYIGPNTSGSEPDGPINEALTNAINSCTHRGCSAPMRLVGVGFVHSIGEHDSFTGAAGGYHYDQWRAPWVTGIVPGTYHHNGGDYRVTDTIQSTNFGTISLSV